MPFPSPPRFAAQVASTIGFLNSKTSRRGKPGMICLVARRWFSPWTRVQTRGFSELQSSCPCRRVQSTRPTPSLCSIPLWWNPATSIKKPAVEGSASCRPCHTLYDWRLQLCARTERSPMRLTSSTDVPFPSRYSTPVASGCRTQKTVWRSCTHFKSQGGVELSARRSGRRCRRLSTSLLNSQHPPRSRWPHVPENRRNERSNLL
mmetsp:Transcript_37691/g.88079  ORF Transcript_37691/g.88079 Transcript_37691/m.88079 type:complete len:205 (+) Transcript_37691:1137-1751(+)